jgi:hypothetical protein
MSKICGHYIRRMTSCLGRLVFFVLLSCSVLSCTHDVTISMDASDPPTFSFGQVKTHVKYLEFFTVKEIAPENQNVPYVQQNTDKNIIIWQIWPKGKSEGQIEDLPPITYGVTPAGFIQKIPEHGAPPALVEGKVYEAGGPPVVMSKGFLRFIIKDGKPVQILVPGRD